MEGRIRKRRGGKGEERRAGGERKGEEEREEDFRAFLASRSKFATTPLLGRGLVVMFSDV